MRKADILLSLHGSAAHNEKIAACQADLKAFKELKADHEDERRRMRGEAYQVASWYVMFQGVLFTAVSQANLLTCDLWWCPVSLSIAVCVAAFLAIADKLYSIGQVQEDINETGLYMSAIMELLDMVDQQGSGLDLETAQPRQEVPPDKLAGYRFIGSKDGISALLFLTGFSVLMAWFSTRSLCLHCKPCAQ